MAINILDSFIANRISAGEVVEKPASIVKELLDNALDAKATEIVLQIKNGGIDFISIRDNGIGIAREDVKKAFLPHATSKISSIEDLNNIQTLGFRGEALASISSVSQVCMITKTADEELASKINVNGGEFGTITSVASEKGTYIEVKNLFYNTPARRKFLRRAKSEENDITNVVSRYILAHPNVSIKYFVGDDIVFYNQGTDLKDAICCVYGADIEQNILPINYEQGNIKISGYIGKVSYSKPNTTYQTLLINDRYVIDEGLSKASYIAYEEFLMSRQFPFFVINLYMPFNEVDVNVHPSKINVKFAHPNEIFDIFYKAIRRTIYNSINPVKEYDYSKTPKDILNQTPNLDTNINNQNLTTPNGNATDILSNKQTETNSSNNQNNEIVEINNDTNNSEKLSNFKNSTQNSNEVVSDVEKDLENYNQNKLTDLYKVDEEKYAQWLNPNKEVEIDPVNKIYPSKDPFDTIIRLEKFVPERNASMFDQDMPLMSSEENPSYQPINNFSNYKVIGEIFNEFLILEKNDVMLLLDFHAGHERLLYDKLVASVNSKQLDIQNLLVPYFHKLNSQELDYFYKISDRLNALGFEIEQFGPDEIRVAGVPAILSDINLKKFVEDLLHDMNNQRPKINEELDRMLMQKACKSAVKAGMTLSEMQINQLLKDLDLNNPVLLCPHGRPIVTVIKRSQIEKWFKRIV